MDSLTVGGGGGGGGGAAHQDVAASKQGDHWPWFGSTNPIFLFHHSVPYRPILQWYPLQHCTPVVAQSDSTTLTNALHHDLYFSQRVGVAHSRSFVLHQTLGIPQLCSVCE